MVVGGHPEAGATCSSAQPQRCRARLDTDWVDERIRFTGGPSWRRGSTAHALPSLRPQLHNLWLLLRLYMQISLLMQSFIVASGRVTFAIKDDHVCPPMSVDNKRQSK
jgi:hypothetical protein